MSHVNRTLSKTLIITPFLTMLVLGSIMVQAAPACTNASLVGTYYFTVAQIYVTPSGPDYCDEFATVIANGAGKTTDSHTRRCSLSGNQTNVPGKMTYKVNTDCSVIFKDVQPAGGLGQPVHGKILMNGDMVLVDGTTRTDNSKLFHAVGVRTSKAKLPVLLKKK